MFINFHSMHSFITSFLVHTLHSQPMHGKHIFLLDASKEWKQLPHNFLMCLFLYKFCDVKWLKLKQNNICNLMKSLTRLLFRDLAMLKKKVSSIYTWNYRYWESFLLYCAEYTNTWILLLQVHRYCDAISNHQTCNMILSMAQRFKTGTKKCSPLTIVHCSLEWQFFNWFYL